MSAPTSPATATMRSTWTHPELAHEPVAWFGTTGPDGQAALVPTWFAWDGHAFLVASKPAARKVRNVRANPRVMIGIARVGVDMRAQLVEGVAEVLSLPSAAVLAGCDLSKYDALLAADGLSWDVFFARYPTAIRVVPTTMLPWQGPAFARIEMPTVVAERHRRDTARRPGLGARARAAIAAAFRRPAGRPVFRPTTA